MPYCPECGNQLTGSESHCPACGQPTDSPPPLLEPSPARTPESLPLGDYLKTGWGLFKQYPGGFVGFCLLYFVIQVALNAIPYVGVVAAAVISTPLLMGNFIVSVKLLHGQPPEFSDFFTGFQYLLPLVLLSVVAGVFISIGTLLLIIPGVYLAVAYLFASYLVVDRGLDFWPAMELSRLTVNPRWFGYFAFMLLLALLNLAGAIALGVGLLVTIPLSFCAVTAAYAEIFGLQTKEY
ncbi:MAG: zinc ribbon domain-containing protein [Desulfobacterales bacterium]|nr:zinc ribbon domain-containing protein [Pseudomonadota bacterium]MBU4356974.1 zinc ribbon domain-containing protein [Pseudomonadota bacterium]MCG2773953.1 zinc ribbon domain-containing protein [Desulfobacterales bacterium]